MNKLKKSKNMAQKLHNANVLPNGALNNISYNDLIIANIEANSNKEEE